MRREYYDAQFHSAGSGSRFPSTPAPKHHSHVELICKKPFERIIIQKVPIEEFKKIAKHIEHSCKMAIRHIFYISFPTVSACGDLDHMTLSLSDCSHL